MAAAAAHKRNLSSGETPPVKKSNIGGLLNSSPRIPAAGASQAPNSALFDGPHVVFIVTLESDDGWGIGESGIEKVFACREDAENFVRRAANEQGGSWSRGVTASGCLKLESVDDGTTEGSMVFEVLKVNLQPKGSVPPTKLENVDEEGDDDDDENDDGDDGNGD